VEVERIQVLSVDLPHVAIEVTCSKGTYVRRLASDLGTLLGPGAHLIALRRLAVGPFRAADAVKADAGSDDWTEALLAERVIRLKEALPHMGEIVLDERLAGSVRQGRRPPREALQGMQSPRVPIGGFVKLVSGNDLVAIARIQDGGEAEGPRIEIERVFASSNTN
jgi:tRNA pseudouridine55 synthase